MTLPAEHLDRINHKLPARLWCGDGQQERQRISVAVINHISVGNVRIISVKNIHPERNTRYAGIELLRDTSRLLTIG